MQFDLKILKRKMRGKRAGKYISLYIYGTEMISSYYSVVGVKNKRVLTIAGSGDQIINAYALGANEVIGFDLNKLAPYFSDLKFTSICSLSFKEFLHFFGKGRNDATFAYELYLKCRHFLRKSSREFFDSLYKNFKKNGQKMSQSVFFHQRNDFYHHPISKINAYLNDENMYLKTKNLLQTKNLEFVVCNVTEISSNKQLKGKFDVINLSNVPNFITHFYRSIGIKDAETYFYEKVILILKRLLTAHGKIIFYAYSPQIYPNPFAKKRPLVTTPKHLNRFKQRKELRYSEFKFKGISGGFDRVIILKK